MKPQSLTHAIAAMRALVRARHGGSNELLQYAESQVKEQGRFVLQVQQALIGNRDGMTLDKVTATWVRAQLNGRGQHETLD